MVSVAGICRLGDENNNDDYDDDDDDDDDDDEDDVHLAADGISGRYLQARGNLVNKAGDLFSAAFLLKHTAHSSF